MYAGRAARLRSHVRRSRRPYKARHRRRAITAEEGIVELASHYPMSFAAVQKHVAILERAGLVSKERVGRRKVVRTNLERLRVVRHLLDEYEELWRGRTDRMADLIANTREHGK